MATLELEWIANCACQLGPAAKRYRARCGRMRRERALWSACELRKNDNASAPGRPYWAAPLAGKLKTTRGEETVKHPASDRVDRAAMTEVLAQIFEPASVGN